MNWRSFGKKIGDFFSNGSEEGYADYEGKPKLSLVQAKWQCPQCRCWNQRTVATTPKHEYTASVCANCGKQAMLRLTNHPKAR